MKKRTLILRDPKTRLTLHEAHLEIHTPVASYRVAFVHLARVYLNKSLDVTIGTCYALSQKAELYLIDHEGYILAKLTEVDDAAV